MIDYQVMPPLTNDEYKELKADIAMRGVMVPIEYDEHGNVLDGHHRIKACGELGITIWPRLVRIGLNDAEKRAHARALNLARRHLNQEQKRELIREQLKDTPQHSDRQIARELGVSPTTVGSARSELEVSGELSKLDSCLGLDGKERPRSTRRKTIFVSEETAERAKSLPEQHRQSVLIGSSKLTEVQRQIRKVESKEKAQSLPLGKYRIIYADPPWTYNDSRQTGDHLESTSASFHYATMSMDELQNMDVKRIASDDSVLFCWSVFPLIQEALDLIKSWGFTYKTAFIWDKGNGAFGHYHNASAELLMIATKGSCVPDADKREDQVQSFARLGHSKKPEEWRKLIDRLYPHGPRIELFHRGSKPDGWTTWGSESND